MAKSGRESRYEEKFAVQAFVAAKGGIHSEARLAELFGVAPSTVHAWKYDHPEFAQAIDRGKMVQPLVKAMFKRGKGYNYTRTVKTKEGADLVVTKEETIHVPASEAAAKLLLYNFDPENFKDRHEVKHDVVPDSPLAQLAESMRPILENRIADIQKGR